MRNARILGMGCHVPDHVVTNADLEQRMDTSDEWIQQRTGIEQRRHVDCTTGAADLGAPAARQAMARAGVGPEDIDCLIVATLSPDVDMPSTACLLQELLDLPPGPAFDVRNQCSGFLYGLAIADKFVRTGAYDRVLLVGAEVHSTGLDLTTRGRDVGVIFGDGAGAVVIGPEEREGKGILSTHLHADGTFAEKLWLQSPAGRDRPRLTPEMLDPEDTRLFPHMEGRYVFRHAVTRLPEVIQEALGAHGLTPADISLLVPHQANLRINQVVAAGLEIPDERVVNNIQRYGNTTGGSIPIALNEAFEAGRVQDGDLVCLAAFGAGFTWGAALIRW